MTQSTQSLFPGEYPSKLRQAIEHVSHRRASEVERFQLVFHWGGMVGDHHNTYFVFVDCNATHVDSRDLVRLLQSLEDDIEDVSGLSVALELSPPAGNVA